MNDAVLCALAVLLSAALAYFFRCRDKKQPTVDVSEFRYPAIPACDVQEPWSTPPLPYRPFRWGKTYNLIMGIRPMRWEDWIQLDRDFMKYHELKKSRFQTRGNKVVSTLPGSEALALEACSEVAVFLSKRYPHLVKCYREEKSGLVERVDLLPTGETWELSIADPMLVAGLLQQDDVALLAEEPNGEYRFVAGSVCLAGSWRLEDKLGQSLAGIHITGHVPGFEGKFRGSMERFFRSLKVHKPVERNNYSFQLDDEIPWSTASYGFEDTYGEGEPTKAANRDKLIPGPIVDGRQVVFRTERQTLRRLPRTGCILFTIRSYLSPVSELAAEPGVPGRLAEAIRTWPEDVQIYKGGKRYSEALLKYLDECHQAQLESGIIDPAAQKSNYPF
ncbi:hypothetical protein AURDEDRAFT_180388 [Auricularia subglabra TFB-10046 SS5]|nr:hypothetical protein AURDEDRAFT_180388 [Auricularia subglabra TFB-10046 SS5]